MTSYRVGDWVYCETSPHQPYVIRKIEELTKTPCGNVEAKVICAFRRQDIPTSVMATVEKFQKENAVKEDGKKDSEPEDKPDPKSDAKPVSDPTANYADDFEEALVANLSDQQKYNLKHREVYFSKYTDTIAATTIRSKCSVLLFNEDVEKYSDYLGRDDSFFYHLTYDPYQKSLVHDQGEIRVGSRYQAEVPALQVTPNGSILEDPNEAAALIAAQEDKRVLRSKLRKDEQPEVPFAIENMEQRIWSPVSSFMEGVVEKKFLNNKLSDTEIDQFMIIAKSIGTYARALDCNNAFKQPSLPLSAASASRDITLFYAMNTLHSHDYDIGKASLAFITKEGPIICKDEIEDWSAGEANLFEEAFDKVGKNFTEIRTEYLPWKSYKSIIEYYYTWKTTDRYVQQKRIKLSEQESKLKQVYIPNHSKQNQSALIKSVHVQLMNQYDTQLKQSCECCGTPNTTTNQWYAYNLTPLTQLIMAGNHNPSALANAALAYRASNNHPNNHVTLQARICVECWNYWKKHHAFKFHNARQERLNQLKNQTHKCSVNGCGREFKLKQLLVKHCGIAHGYFAKTNLPPGQDGPRPSAIRNRTSFYLLTTPMTRAARLTCTSSIKIRKLSRKPFKLVELTNLNKEWTKDPKRNIENIINDYKKKKFESRKLSKDLISVIAKNYAKILKRKKQNDRKLANEGSVGQNGNHDENTQEDENSEDELVIDNDDEVKPEFLNYFENKCTTPCYVPEKLIWVKPDKDTMNKFYENLMTQNRKRPHEAISQNGEAATNGKNENSSTDSSPLSKRINSYQNNGVNKTRMPQKSVKPIQSINLVNAPEEIYYVANKQLKSYRKEIELPSLRKLSRKPSKELPKTYENLYDNVGKIRTESMAKIALTKKADTKTNGDVENKKVEENGEKKVEEGAVDIEMGEDTKTKGETETDSTLEVEKESVVVE